MDRDKQIRLSKDLCAGEREAVRAFQIHYHPLLVYIAKEKYAKRIMRPIPFSKELVLKYMDQKWILNDDEMNAYKWLVGLVQRKSCGFQGKEDFNNYIMTILNSKLSFIDYTRAQFQADDELIRTPVSKDYVPKAVMMLGDTHVILYKYVLTGQDDIQPVCDKLNISYDEGIIMRDEIYKVLASSGRQLQVLPKKFRVSEFDPDIQDDKHKPFDLKNAEDQEDLMKRVLQIMEALIAKLNKEERRLMQAYWSDKKVKELFDTWRSLKLNILDRLNITKPNDIYKVIERIIRNALKIAKDDFPAFVNEYKIDETRMRQLLSVYVEYWYKNKLWENNNFESPII